MKKKTSIKLRLTLWFTAFMAMIAALCLGLIIVIGSSVSENEASDRLSRTVRADIENIDYTEGKLSLMQGFSFYKDGVYTMIYNHGKALLGGETPPGFPVSEDLENGAIRTVRGGDEVFLVFDLYVPSGWEDGIWVRGATEYPEMEDSLGRSVSVFLFILPFLILLAAAGGYLIARHSMKPIERITELAGSISEGKDLDRRIASEYEASDEAGRLAAAFDQMFERLSRSFEAEKQFASDASHELRTPTAVIVAQCEYKNYVRFDETVEIFPEVTYFNGIRMTIEYRMLARGSGKLCALGKTTHCFTSPKMKPLSLKKYAPDMYAVFAGCVTPGQEERDDHGR